MYDGGKIITGLIIFVLIFTSPLWYNLAANKYTYKPEPKILTPDKKCIEPKAEMLENHMQILNDWRTEVVRIGGRWTETKTTGEKVEMSLSRTCMDCHKNKSQFCDRCHDYVGVSPYCWECHVEPKEDL